MKIDPIDFAGLMCSRLCHDLLSPVGALGNGIELLGDEQDPEMRAQCLTLLETSAQATAGKLKFFRLAFGAAGGFGDMVSTPEVQEALTGIFPPAKRVTLNWLVQDRMVPKLLVKLLLNLAAIAGDALARGGQIDIDMEIDGRQAELVVRAAGERLTLDPMVRQALTGAMVPADLSIRVVAAWMVRDLVMRRGGQLQVSAPEAPSLVFGAMLPLRD
jgi:histidine phosphotransferase ChpT